MNLLTLPAVNPLLSKKSCTQSVATATSEVDQTGRAQLFMLSNPSTACCLTSPTQTVTFRSPSYHLPRLFSETVGIASPLLTNVIYYLSFTIEILLDLEGLNCIRAHSILSVNFLNDRLVQATVVVMFVMSSMYALIGGSRIPEAKHSSPTTHLYAL